MLSKSINIHSVTDSEAGELNTLQPCISHGAAAKWCTFPDSELHHNWLPCEYSHSNTQINLRRGRGIWKHKTPDFSISNPIRLLSLSPSGQVSVQSIGRTDGQGIQILYLLLCSTGKSGSSHRSVCIDVSLGGRVLMQKARRCPQPPLQQTVVWTEDSRQVSPAFHFLCKAKHWARKTMHFPISSEAP